MLRYISQNSTFNLEGFEQSAKDYAQKHKLTWPTVQQSELEAPASSSSSTSSSSSNNQ